MKTWAWHCLSCALLLGQTAAFAQSVELRAKSDASVPLHLVGDALTKDYELVNGSDKRIHMQGAKLSCGGCTTVEPSVLDVDPGRSGALRMTVHLPSIPGEFRFTAFPIIDGRIFDRPMEIRGTAVRPIAWTPGVVRFSFAESPRGSVGADLTFKNNLDQNLAVSLVSSNSVELSPSSFTIAPGASTACRVTCACPRAAGSWSERLELVTRYRGDPLKISVPVRIHWQSSFVFYPPVINLGETGKGVSRTVEVLVASSSGLPIKNVSIEGSQNGQVHCTLKAATHEGNKVRLVLGMFIAKDVRKSKLPVSDRLKCVLDGSGVLVDVYGILRE